MPSVKATLDAIAGMHKEMPFEKHPLWAGVSDGVFSKKQVGEFARQYGIIPLHNHNYHGRLYVLCPDPKWRARLAEVVYEEGTGKIFSKGIPHNQLYLNFSRGLGIRDEDMWQADYCAQAVAFKCYFQDVCSHDIVEGIAAHMLASEAQGPGFFSGMARRMRKNYGLSAKAVDFWVIHDEADSEHSSVGAELLGDFAKTDQDRERVIRTAREMIEMSMLLYDGILRRVKALGR